MKKDAINAESVFWSNELIRRAKLLGQKPDEKVLSEFNQRLALLNNSLELGHTKAAIEHIESMASLVATVFVRR